MPGTQRHPDGGSSRLRTAGVRLRIPAGRARVLQAGQPVVRRLAGRAAVLAGLPILILGLAAGTAAAAASGGGQVTNPPYTSTNGIDNPAGITAWNGALWFTNQDGSDGSIGEITTSGSVTSPPYTGTGIDDPVGITAWNGALWFTNFNSGTGGSIGEITVSTTGAATVSNIAANSTNKIDGPEGITAGPVVNGEPTLWFTNAGNDSIGEITYTSSGQVQVNNYTGTGIDDPTSITLGPDGALWFTNNQNDTIGEITTSGTVSNCPNNDAPDTLGAGPTGITAGPDGAVWFTNIDGGPDGTGSIERMTTCETYNVYDGTSTSVVNPTGITAGPDGALWFTNNGNGTGTTIGRITTSGTIDSYSGGPGVDGSAGITTGPDKALWFTNAGNNSIGRVTPPAAQTITFTSTPPSPAVYGGSYTVSATATSGLFPVTFTIDTASTKGACSISGSTSGSATTPSTALVTFSQPGNCIIDANQAGNANWLPAAQAQQTITIGQAPQTITFTSTPPTNPPFGSSYTVSATGGGSGNLVTFNIDASGLGPCVISGSTVTFISAGSCTIGANQAGNTDYQAATATQTITVPQEAPVLTWPEPANIAHGVPLSSTQLDATANVPGTFTYSPPAGTVLALGTHTLTATFTPANTTNYTGGTVSTQITVVTVQVPPCPTCNK